MCGILIDYTKKNLGHLISHRGVESNSLFLSDVQYTFHRLPFQTLGEPHSWFYGPGEIFMFNGELFGLDQPDTEYLIDLLSTLVEGNPPAFPIDDLIDHMVTWDGMWAISFQYKGVEYYITDPLGKKSLYYTKDGSVVCSEPLFELSGDYEPLYSSPTIYPTDRTNFTNWLRMIPGCIYVRTAGDINMIRYSYFLGNRISNNRENNYRDLIINAIKTRMVNGYEKATLFLSGGLDSSILAYELVQLGYTNSNIEFLSIENKEDLSYLNYIEDYLGIQVKRIPFESIPPLELTFFYKSDLDLGSVSPQYQLCSVAQEHLILTGDGADELFGGYSRAHLRDTRMYDLFVELPYYHNPRLDKLGMAFTKEIRSPFQSNHLISYELGNPRDIGKEKLKETYAGLLPYLIIHRKKDPLRSKDFHFYDQLQLFRKAIKNNIDEFRYSDSRG